MTTPPSAPEAPESAPGPVVPEVPWATPPAPVLLRWAIEHYMPTLPEGTTFPLARAMFATNVLLRDDKTVRRWLARQTEVDPRVRAFLARKYQEAGHGPVAYRRSLKRTTNRELLWER